MEILLFGKRLYFSAHVDEQCANDILIRFNLYVILSALQMLIHHTRVTVFLLDTAGEERYYRQQ
jgi:hypothetical protein